ncbi:toxin VasX, partial [Achromobacter arsenitoxydans]
MHARSDWRLDGRVAEYGVKVLMYSWKETFELCAENRRWIENELKSGPAVTCTRSFIILPLRYGAVGGAEISRNQLPPLPVNAADPYKVGMLSESSYALRPLRQGFLYVLIKRKQKPYEWHSQYRVSEISTLTYIDADKPWEPPASAGAGGSTRLAWSLKIFDVDGIDDLRFLFSPVPLTSAVRDKYRTQESHRQTMRSVN